MKNATIQLLILSLLTAGALAISLAGTVIAQQPTPKTTSQSGKIKIVGIEVDAPEQPAARPTPTPRQLKGNPTATPTPQSPTNGTRGYIKKQVTLVVGVATRFKSPETPLQLILGNNTGFKVIESIGENSADFYLLPKQGGFSTNMFVEFSNSTTEVRLTVIDPKKGAVYDTEVQLDYEGSRPKPKTVVAKVDNAQIEQLQKQVETLNGQLASEKTRAADLQTQLAAAKSNNIALEPLFFNLYDRQKTVFESKNIDVGAMRVNVIGAPVATSPGRYVLLAVIVNRDKKKTLTLSTPEIDGFEGSIKPALEGELKPGESRRVLLEFTAERITATPRLKFQQGSESEFAPLGPLQITASR